MSNQILATAPALVTVTLTRYETEIADFIGSLRQRDNEEKGRKDAHDFPKYLDPLKIHQNGAAAEMAVAKYLNKYWDAVVDVKSLDSIKADVDKYQVRSVSNSGDRDLRLMAKDKDQIFISVIRKAPVFELIGWMKASEGRIQKYYRQWRGESWAWFVPEKDLHPMSELRGAR